MNEIDPDNLATAHVMNAGKALYGEHWAKPLAACLNVSERTIQRIAAAARDQTGFPAARNLIEPLQRVLTSRALEFLNTASNMNDARDAMNLPAAMCTTYPIDKLRSIGRPPHYLITPAT